MPETTAACLRHMNPQPLHEEPPCQHGGPSCHIGSGEEKPLKKHIYKLCKEVLFASLNTNLSQMDGKTVDADFVVK